MQVDSRQWSASLSALAGGARASRGGGRQRRARARGSARLLTGSARAARDGRAGAVREGPVHVGHRAPRARRAATLALHLCCARRARRRALGDHQ